jgi:hypothetical protein
MNNLNNPEWQKSYQETLLETNEEKLKEKILLTEWKVFQRLQQISSGNDHQGERQAIADAMSALLTLQRDRLGYPDWESALKKSFPRQDGRSDSV